MPSNLRAKRMQGYVTDSAGNVLRNADIIVKEDTPLSVNTVATVVSDDDGSFTTPPLPAGTYDIYESGVRVARQIHEADQNAIQCFKANPLNHPNDFPEFVTLASRANNMDLNDFRYPLQIEAESIDVSVYGSTFPLLDRPLITTPGIYGDLASFYSLTDDSRITTTRFDVEYYAPLTSTDKTYRRIRWAGVPAIRFYLESKLILPLDFFSIIASMPKGIYNLTGTTGSFPPILSGEPLTIDAPSVPEFTTLKSQLVVGDIVKFTTTAGVWYGIYHSRSGTSIVFTQWKSSQFPSIATGTYLPVTSAEHFDAMFNTIENINELINERFTVVENIFAQNQTVELYTYENA